MLIYNYKKEFIGIDEKDLTVLGFSNLLDLKNEAADFADMFVKTPGYIHNFKHVHWIDFVLCADISEDSKVIIHAKNKNFICSIDVKTAYLIDNPNKNGYIINLNNLRELSKSESERISADIKDKELNKVVPTSNSVVSLSETTKNDDNIYKLSPTEVVEDEFDMQTPIVDDLFEDGVSYTDEIQKSTDTEPQNQIFQSQTNNEEKITLDEDLQKEDVAEIEIDEPAPLQPDEEKKPAIDNFNKEYIYDPSIASKDLGLPVDLIEEFIEDFIHQAEDFKSDLYESIERGDINNIKILSHKLKGVAANLRIENALDTLTVVNSSQNIDEIRDEMDIFYKIIDQLSNKKEDEFVIKDSDVPQQIEIAELADDEFLKHVDDVVEAPDLMDGDLIVNDLDVPQHIEMAELADDEFLKHIDDEVVTTDLIDEELLNDSDVAGEIEAEELSDDEFLKEIEEVIETPDLVDEESTLNDSDVPKQIEMAELADDEFLKHVDDVVEAPDFQEHIFESTSQKEDEAEVLEENSLKEDLQPIYEKKIVADDLGIDDDSFNELFNDFINDAKILQSTIQDAINQNDNTKWKQESLKLKGMSDNMRIDSFKDELDTLTQTTQAPIAQNAIENINKKLQQL